MNSEDETTFEADALIWALMVVMGGCGVIAGFVNTSLTSRMVALLFLAFCVSAMTTVMMPHLDIRKTALKIALFLFVPFFVTTPIVYYFWAKPETDKAIALKAETSKGHEAVAAAFERWTATTNENGTALQWSGKDSQTVLIAGPLFPEDRLFKVLAKSSGGRFFEVFFFLEGPPFEWTVYQGPHVRSQAQVVEQLVNIKRVDLIEKFGLPRTPA